VRAGDLHRAHRLADAAGLGQLEVDAVGEPGHLGDRPGVLHRLVEEHRQPVGQLAQLAVAVDVGDWERLLDVLDAEGAQLGHELAGGLVRPALVAVDAQPGGGVGAYGAQPLEVVRTADLDLEDLEALRLLDPFNRPVDTVQADGERGRGQHG